VTLLQVRARAFDVVFNLTLHSALLEPVESWEGREQELEQAPMDAEQQQQQQQGLRSHLSGGSSGAGDAEAGGPPAQDPSTKHGQMMAWLRALCMQLLSDITEVGEGGACWLHQCLCVYALF